MTFLQQQALILMQSLLGVISPNFRMVYIAEFEKRIMIKIILETESSIDREEIDDLVAEFEALQSCQIDFEIDVEVTSAELLWPNGLNIVVFRRRENSL
jgi:hypothetical protein